MLAAFEVFPRAELRFDSVVVVRQRGDAIGDFEPALHNDVPEFVGRIVGNDEPYCIA